MEKNYMYHITNIKNVESIIKNGLKVNEYGKLFLFEGVDFLHTECVIDENGKYEIINVWEGVNNFIARNELFLKEYAVFAVECSVNMLNNMEIDKCGEYASPYQRIYHKNISKNKVIYCGNLTTKSPNELEKEDF